MSARVLIVEDNPANLELMDYLLSASGYLTLKASDGKTGLLAAENTIPDLVVCDIQMPVMNGYELAKSLKNNAKLRHIPLVAVTALAMTGDGDKILAAGFDGYLVKPITPETFVQQLEAYLTPGQHEKGGIAYGDDSNR